MNRITRLIAVTTLGVTLPFAGGVTAAYAQNVELVTRAEREIDVDEKGKKVKKLVAPTKMVPGDDVLYTVSYHNKSKAPAEKVVITNPVPKHTRYKDGSAAGEGADIAFSVDGGKTFATPDKLTVTIRDKAGKDVARPPPRRTTRIFAGH